MYDKDVDYLPCNVFRGYKIKGRRCLRAVMNKTYVFYDVFELVF